MAVVAHLVEKTKTSGQNDVLDGVRAMIVAIDDGVDTTDALVKVRGATVARAAGIPLPDDYFDANRSVAGVFDAAGDNVIFKAEKLNEEIA